jgi:hypothetical protein
LSITTASDKHLELVKDLIHHELHKWKDKPGNIFRANSLASKTIGQYVSKKQKKLKKTFKNKLEENI